HRELDVREGGAVQCEELLRDFEPTVEREIIRIVYAHLGIDDLRKEVHIALVPDLFDNLSGDSLVDFRCHCSRLLCDTLFSTGPPAASPSSSCTATGWAVSAAMAAAMRRAAAWKS